MQKILPGGIYRLSLSSASNEQCSTIDVVVLSGGAFIGAVQPHGLRLWLESLKAWGRAHE